MSVTVNIQGQPVELLETDSLAIINNKTRPVDSFILDKFFPNKVSFNNRDTVPLDELDTNQPLAPFVSPLAQGKPITAQGSFNREYVKAAYLKPSEALTPDSAYSTALLVTLQQAGVIGSTNGLLTRAEQLRIAQVGLFNRLRESIVNRKKLMAIDVLISGQTTCVGDDFPSQLVDFKRSAKLNFAPSVKWTQPTAKPVTDIRAMNDLLIDEGGEGAKVALMSSKVFSAFSKSEEFKQEFREPQGLLAPSPLNTGSLGSVGAKYRGEVDGIEFWTYDETHKLNGLPQRFIDAKGFYLIADTSGYQAQCEIKHFDAYGSALEFFDYQIIERDPSGIKMLCDSSPLIVPSNVNGAIGGNLFID